MIYNLNNELHVQNLFNFNQSIATSVQTFAVGCFKLTMPKRISLSELQKKKYGRLSVLAEAGDKIEASGRLRRMILCKCDCGNQIITRASSIKSFPKSCGCLWVESMVTHGKSYTREYKAWRSMKERCLNKNHKYFRHYGGRGITICEEWLKFENFYKDMGDKPTLKHSLDRIDNEKGYYKENCRWATLKEQNNNKRNSILIKIKGVSKGVEDWCKVFKINKKTVRSRIFRGDKLDINLFRSVNNYQ